MRRFLWVTITICSLAVLVGGGALIWLLLRGPNYPTGLIVVSDSKQMRLIQDNGEERTLADNVDATSYRYPAVSRDRHQVAYIATDGDDLLIMRLNLASNERTELYRSSVSKPFDLAWSPDGKYIIFLAQGEDNMTTNIVPENGSQPSRVVSSGFPSFFAWKPDSSALLLHQSGHTVQGGRIEMYQVGQDRSNSLLSDPGFFQAPAWSMDGASLFYVAQPPISNPQPTIDDIESSIIRVSADGKSPHVLISEKRSDIRIVRSPSSDALAYLTIRIDGPQSFSWEGLRIIDENGGAPRIISRPDEHVTTFFWSPDGKQIAYLTHNGEFSSGGPRTWHIVDVSTGTIRDFATFTPSAALADLQKYFDAYLFSFSPWSPDSKRLSYGAENGIYILDVATGKAEQQADGMLSMWVGK